MVEDWPRPVVHWEITARDPERQRSFYAGLFNWSNSDGPIMSVPAGLGGPEPGPGVHILAGERAAVTLYVQVQDLDESLSRTAELGGRIVRARLQVPQGATMAIIEDPEGNRVLLVQQ